MGLFLPSDMVSIYVPVYFKIEGCFNNSKDIIEISLAVV